MLSSRSQLGVYPVLPRGFVEIAHYKVLRLNDEYNLNFSSGMHTKYHW